MLALNKGRWGGHPQPGGGPLPARTAGIGSDVSLQCCEDACVLLMSSWSEVTCDSCSNRPGQTLGQSQPAKLSPDSSPSETKSGD